MSIYEKMKNEKINIDIDEFIKLIDQYSKDSILDEEIDLIMTKKFGPTLNEIWKLANFKEKIEIIILLHIKSEIKNEGIIKYENLNNFYKWNKMKIFINKLEKFVKKEGYEIKENKEGNLILIENEISNLLSKTNDENLKNIFWKFRKANNLKDKEAEIFKIQKEIYKNIRNDKTEFDILNIKKIKRLNEVFVRHGKEANDKKTKEYYDQLSDKEKIEKLNDLFLAFLILNIRYKKK